ncbi:methyl-accepting chemotaxis protein [Desulfallas thermosapovorans]|uniref:Methyl-accepting chemotaxis protein n=1 Tax=Desulfallas thermosapovorans DSM 6562 TaxID=1121431 RepID=A0A5S4ZNQ7_9FIRM|nr:methyl-accepting chemotaxis protein [Desulfallas thermosapovorans]TYO93367.1 methyl-accepting chemotaxis protein [Desulfallas thermosapovorans DSM 6562]
MGKSIRLKIIAPVTLIISLVLLLLIYQDYKSKVHLQLEQEGEKYELVAQRVLADMNNIFNQAKLGLESVAANPEIQEAFARRDRERLQNLTMPIYERVSREGIEQFQFHLAPATSFLRLHAPDQYGDDLSSFRHTVLECNSTGNIVQGLEEGKGGFGFRVVLPVFFQGDQVGSVEYGPGLNATLLEKWQQQMGGDYYIYGKPASGVAWEEQEGLLVATAGEDPYPVSESDINTILSSKETRTIYVDNDRKAALIIPLEDYSGQPVGYIKIINDRSEVIAGMTRELRYMQIQAVIAVLVVLIVTLVITTYITRPLSKLSAVVGAVAGGDLTQPVIRVKSKDEVGVLAEALATMVHNLSDMISNVKGCSRRLADFSQELVSSSEEVSAAVEEVAGTASQVSVASAGGAQDLAGAARESEQVRIMAEEGNQAVQKTVDKIKSIAAAAGNVSRAVHMLSEQSNRIGEIISTITNIADRTNLLALNAAIEAARAGEQGRGFAVVAEDVRKLAEQSAGAANEITLLVKDIQSGVGEAVKAIEHGTAEVSDGVQVAEQAGKALNQIVEAMEKSMGMIKGAAASSQKASEDVQQLSGAAEQIATAIEQVTEAAQNLANMADEMQRGVVKFKIA